MMCTWIVTSATVPAALELSLVAFLYLSMVAFTLQLHKEYATGVSAHMHIYCIYMHIHEGDAEMVFQWTIIVCGDG